VRRLCSRSVRFLEAAWDAERALFSYSTTVRDGGYVQDFGHPASVRYTVNTLLGLQEAARHDTAGDPFLAEVDGLVDRFLAVHGTDLPSRADVGLLTLLLSERGNVDRAARTVEAIGRAVTGGDQERLVLQDVAWLLHGACAAARQGVPGAEAVAGASWKLLHRSYLDRDSLLARHGSSRARRHVVSFGATAYYLRALHEYATTFGDEYVETIFRNAVDRVIGLQGPYGDWPWMIGVSLAQPLDVYPVFSVHQDSMAMLFLLPAVDRGLAGASEAVERSLTWLTGVNELGVSMVVESPFIVHRSIERDERQAQLRRYARSVWRAAARRPGTSVEGRGVRVNPECRSYHLGWVLYVWSGREDAPDLRGLASSARQNGAAPSSGPCRN
jgi:hypothetical protein